MDFLSPVHTAPEKFKNAALLPRSGLPSTLIRHENEVFIKPVEFENTSFMEDTLKWGTF